MADWTDFLEDFSAGASGIVNGITQGAKPFDAWENIRTKDLANDKSDIALRDLYFQQMANENTDDYYGNAAGARDSTYRKTSAANETDIFGNQQKLALAQYLADPEGAFQQGVEQAGLTPGSPEYRSWLAQAIDMYDPLGGEKAYDTFKIPEGQNRNLNEQTALRFIEMHAQQKDPNARIVRNPDGTVSLVSQGEEIPISGDQLMKVAAMIDAKTPYDALSKGLKDETIIQKGNSDFYKALQTGQITPASAAKMFQEQGVRLNQAYTGARQELAAITKSADFTTASPEEQATMTQDLRARITNIKQQMDQNQQLLNQVVMHNALPRMTGGAPSAPGPRIAPQGGSSVTTRPPPGSIAARAAGANIAPWGQSSQGPAYPTPRVSPQDTGVRPITQGDSGMDPQILAFLQMMGAA